MADEGEKKMKEVKIFLRSVVMSQKEGVLLHRLEGLYTQVEKINRRHTSNLKQSVNRSRHRQCNYMYSESWSLVSAGHQSVYTDVGLIAVRPRDIPPRCFSRLNHQKSRPVFSNPKSRHIFGHFMQFNLNCEMNHWANCEVNQEVDHEVNREMKCKVSREVNQPDMILSGWLMNSI